MSAILVSVIVIAYLLTGVAFAVRAMNHVRANALKDETYFIMSIQSAKPTLSMILPQLSVIVAWPAFVLVALILARSEGWGGDIATDVA